MYHITGIVQMISFYFVQKSLFWRVSTNLPQSFEKKFRMPIFPFNLKCFSIFCPVAHSHSDSLLLRLSRESCGLRWEIVRHTCVALMWQPSRLGCLSWRGACQSLFITPLLHSSSAFRILTPTSATTFHFCFIVYNMIRSSFTQTKKSSSDRVELPTLQKW